MWSRPRGPVAGVCALGLVVLIGVAAAATGAVHTRIFGHDIFVFLDAGWRVLNGQRPEIDFNPSMGALVALLAAAGLKLAGNSVHGIGYMSGFVAIVAGCWAYGLTRGRMGAVGSTMAACVVALIAAAPFPIGWHPNVLSHAMVYNRYGYALLGVLILECFAGSSRGVISGMSSGLLCVALVFIKPSYSAVGLALVAASYLLERQNWRRTAGLAVGAIAAGIAMMAYLRFDFGALWSDLRMLSAARGSGLSLWNFRWALFKGSTEFLPLALLSIVVAALRGEARPIFIAGLLWGAGAALLASNAQTSGYPLNAVLALILLEQGISELGCGETACADRFPSPRAILVLLALICYLPVTIGSASGLVYAFYDSRNKPPATLARFHEASLANLMLYDTPDGTDADLRSNGRIYVGYVNDGASLIQRVSTPEETVFVLDMVNPFSYALQRHPAPGGSPALSFDHTFNDRNKPEADRLFGSADIVLVPKRPASAAPDAAALLRNYLPEIEAQRRLCAESEWWKVYKKPDHLQGCATPTGPLHSIETSAR